jgi:predicted enzyme related to lactoylglutathione lyase
MGQPVVWFEIIGRDPAKLKGYYSDLFGWTIESDNPMNYGMVRRENNDLPEDGGSIGGGVAGPGPDGYPGHVTFYAAVPDVEEALAKGREPRRPRVMGPETIMDMVDVGEFKDPEGHLVGVVKPL